MNSNVMVQRTRISFILRIIIMTLHISCFLSFSFSSSSLAFILTLRDKWLASRWLDERIFCCCCSCNSLHFLSSASYLMMCRSCLHFSFLNLSFYKLWHSRSNCISLKLDARIIYAISWCSCEFLLENWHLELKVQRGKSWVLLNS